MKAAYYERFSGPINIVSLPDPTPSVHDVVLEVLATGLCLSDWHGWKGYDPDIRLPHVPGHELVGKIVEIGEKVHKFKVGQRVTLPFVCGCGTCQTCSSGNPQVCPSQFQPGFTHWGSFAEYVGIQYADANLVALPDSINSVTAASLGCRFATSFRAIMQLGRVKQDETVVVFGCGGVGLSAIMIASANGARVIAVDQKISALERAVQVGASDSILSNPDNHLPTVIKDITNGGAHLTVDAIGHPKVVHDAISSLRRRGRHIQIGLLHPNVINAPIPMDKVIGYELEIMGSHGMAASHYPKMIEMIENRHLKPELLIDQTITLEEAVEALPLMNTYAGSGVRVVDRF